MHYIFPDYYKKFSCIAGSCPASCCNTDWDIEIDPETKEYYEDVEGPVGDKIRSLMVPADDADSGEGSAIIRAAKNHRCPFLDKNNLCEIYLSLGEDGFCQTCREYPRYFGEAGDLIQEDLSLSCPEVARMFFSDKDMIHYHTESDIMDGEDLSLEEEKLLEKVITFRNRFISSPAAGRHFPAKEGLVNTLKETEPLSPLWEEALCCMGNTSCNTEALPAWAQDKLTQYFIFRYSIDIMYGSTFEEVLNLTWASVAAMSLLFSSKWQPDPQESCQNIPGAAQNCTAVQLRLMDAAVLYSRQMEHSEKNIEILKGW